MLFAKNVAMANQLQFDCKLAVSFKVVLHINGANVMLKGQTFNLAYEGRRVNPDATVWTDYSGPELTLRTTYPAENYFVLRTSTPGGPPIAVGDCIKYPR